jgi:acyl carrier protein
MDKKEITAKVCEIVAKQLRKPIETVTPDKNLKEDLAADSLDVVEMMMNLEDQYGITISDEELINLKTIADVADYIFNASLKK